MEAKAEDVDAAAGMQQAREYTRILGLQFAYATNGLCILEFDAATGQERELPTFPTPDQLLARWRQGKRVSNEDVQEHLLEPFFSVPGKIPRYYQEIAVNRCMQAILSGKRRVLLTIAATASKIRIIRLTLIVLLRVAGIGLLCRQEA